MYENKVVVITGCSTGIGRALASAFARVGASVVATARRPETLDGLDARPVALDVNDPTSIAATVTNVMDHEGRIDVLVNNAGINRFGPILEQPADELRAIFDTNVLGLLAMCRAVFPHMAEQGGGHIVNIGSIAGVLHTPWAGAYAASKAAVHMVSNVMRLEARPFGIDITVVQPGAVRSSISATAAPNIERYRESTSRYQGAFAGIEARTHASQDAPMEAEEFATTLVAELAERPRLIRLGGGVDMMAQLAEQPEEQVDMMVSARFGLGAEFDPNRS